MLASASVADLNLLVKSSDAIIGLVKDSDLEVRRQSFLTVAAIFKARLLVELINRDSLEKTVLPSLYDGLFSSSFSLFSFLFLCWGNPFL
jgi:hypothetical protein